MFNPKGNNLLDEQMAVAGLEMQWLPAVIAGVGAVASGIMGSQQASASNKANKKAAKKQKKYNKKIAKITNKHNKKLDAADRANYDAMRDYSTKTSMQNWQRGAEIQDFEYLQSLRQYQKSVAITGQQLQLNNMSARLGAESEQAVLEEAFIQQQFQHQQNMGALKQTYVEQNLNRQEAFNQLAGIRNRKDFGNLSFQNTVDQLMTQGALSKEAEQVQNLVSEGSIQAAGQAGKSTAKSLQSNMAQMHRSLMALDSELSGKYKQAAVQLAELNADASLQEAGVGLNLERIDVAIENAESEAEGNIEVMRENMRSTIAQTQRNIKQIELERRVSNLNTRASMMLKPERLSYDPKPEPPPERIFVDRLKAIPGFTPPPQTQSTWAPLISGFAKGAGHIASADFSKPWHGGD